LRRQNKIINGDKNSCFNLAAIAWLKREFFAFIKLEGEEDLYLPIKFLRRS